MKIGTNEIDNALSRALAPGTEFGPAIGPNEYTAIAAAFQMKNKLNVDVSGNGVSFDSRSWFVNAHVDSNPALIEALRTGRTWEDYLGMRNRDQGNGATLAARAASERKAAGLEAGDIKAQRSDVMRDVRTGARVLREKAQDTERSVGMQDAPNRNRVFASAVEEQLSSPEGQRLIAQMEAAKIPNARETLRAEILRRE